MAPKTLVHPKLLPQTLLNSAQQATQRQQSAKDCMQRRRWALLPRLSDSCKQQFEDGGKNRSMVIQVEASDLLRWDCDTSILRDPWDQLRCLVAMFDYLHVQPLLGLSARDCSLFFISIRNGYVQDSGLQFNR